MAAPNLKNPTTINGKTARATSQELQSLVLLLMQVLVEKH